jgi:ubiquinol oxidase
MTGNNIDLKKEQLASLKRPRYEYSWVAKAFFKGMDLITGPKTTFAKAKLIEILASIPYRAWEIRQYGRTTFGYKSKELVQHALEIMAWGREAQDNEYWHLRVINEKMKEDELKDPWYLFPPIPFLIVVSYIILTRLMAVINIHSAFHFNAHFEDHAEHVYAQFVEDHPEWEKQPVKSELVKGYGTFDSWADVFRRVGLDERDHMNNSFLFCGQPESVVKYEGMPEGPRF